MTPETRNDASEAAADPSVVPESSENQRSEAAATATAPAATAPAATAQLEPQAAASANFVANTSVVQVTGKRKTPEPSTGTNSNPSVDHSRSAAELTPSPEETSKAELVDQGMAYMTSDGLVNASNLTNVTTAPVQHTHTAAHAQSERPSFASEQQIVEQRREPQLLHVPHGQSSQQMELQQQHQQHQLQQILPHQSVQQQALRPQQSRLRSRNSLSKQQQQALNGPPEQLRTSLAGFPVWQTPPHAQSTPCCPHYMRNCHLRAPCCNALVACRRCHDALVPDGHPLDRRAVKMVCCLSCGSRDQPLASNCAFCSIRFAAYFCAKCAMYDDTPGRSIFHCDGCGICRLGRREDFRHCETCCACLPVNEFDRHKCARNALNRPCPLCSINMHESVRQCIIPACGHAMHRGCFEHHLKSSFACRVCGKSVVKMKLHWEKLDRLLENDLARITEFVNIKCRDCGQVGKAKMHKHFHKCSNPACGSYNTFVK